MTLRGRRPGDRRVRAGRVQPQGYRILAPKRIRRPPSPWLVLIATFAILTMAGTTLLALPLATEPGVDRSAAALDALFTASSAVSGTGLILHDTAEHWSLFGEIVILALMQVGGFAFMTGSTMFFMLIVGGQTSLSDRIRVQAAGGLADLGNVASLVRAVAIFTLVCEAVGAVVLAAVFLARGTEPTTAIGWGIFHAVSAFNNAGFDLFGASQSLTQLADAPALLIPLGTLIVLGGLGFAIVGDVMRRRRWVRLALETKMVLFTTAVLLTAGAVGTAALEWSNGQTLGRLDPIDRLVNAIFHSASLRSAGFDSVVMGGLTDESLVLGIGLMFIGGASGSTAGGIRLTTLAVLVVAAISAVRGDPSATAFGRRIPHVIVYRAIAIFLVAVAGAFALTLAVQLTGAHAYLDVAYETVSALGTVGVSTGLTTDLHPVAHVMLAAAMFVGRLGPLTLVLALGSRSRPVAHRPAIESVRIG